MDKERKLTPAMVQFYEIKKQYSDCVIFFRMWDFYEMFDDDAYIAHDILWITLTSKNKNDENSTVLAWIPYHSIEKYLPTFVKAWYKIAIVEQVWDPKLKWIVKREVARVVTPSTLWLEWDNFSKDEDNYIVSITKIKWFYWISILDISSNNWRAFEFTNQEELLWELYKISPKEVVIDKEIMWENNLIWMLEKRLSLNVFFYNFSWDCKDFLTKHFKVQNLISFWLEERNIAQKACCILLSYMLGNQKNDMDFLDKLHFEENNKFMSIDSNTIRSLDLIFNISTWSDKIWTLFWVIDDTKTAMWKRKLKYSLTKPLQDIEKIKLRQEVIEEFLEDQILLDKVQDKLKMVWDIDLILNRLSIWRASPKDLLNLKKSLIAIKEVFLEIKENSPKLAKKFQL